MSDIKVIFLNDLLGDIRSMRTSQSHDVTIP